MLEIRLVATGDFALPSAKNRVEPPKTVSLADIRQLAESLSKVLEDDKAEDLAFIDLQGKSSLADFMIIASGRSGRHVAALAEHVAQEAKRRGAKLAIVNREETDQDDSADFVARHGIGEVLGEAVGVA